MATSYTSIASRLEFSPRERLTLALNVPVVYKVGEVAVLGQNKQARIAGFGDVSLEGSYRLGAIGAHEVILTLSLPTGSADAVRQGIVLPQHLQLGSGVPGLTAQYEQTRDQVWGLVLFGATASYNGWENDIGDYRAPSATAYAHVGYLLDRWVPSAGLTLFGKPSHDRERGADRPAENDPLVMLIPSVGMRMVERLDRRVARGHAGAFARRLPERVGRRGRLVVAVLGASPAGGEPAAPPATASGRPTPDSRPRAPGRR